MVAEMKRLLVVLTVLWLVPIGVLAAPVPALVGARWLIKNLHRPNLAIIEISDQISFTFDGHIPGSVLTTKSDWRYLDTDGSLVHFPPDQLEKRIRGLGVNDHDGVVIYYKGDNTDQILGAFYLYWLFHLLGHTNVGILDEGWYGWQKADGNIEDQGRDIKPGNFVARPLLALEISTDELDRIGSHYLLVDGRPESHFKGLTKFAANPRYGRIPGSANQPWRDYMRRTPDGRWYAEAPELPRLLKRLKIKRQQPILLTCLGGPGAAFNYAMFYAAGFHNMRLHDAGLRRWNARKLPLEGTRKHNNRAVGFRVSEEQ